MTRSLTERKRFRKSFGRVDEIVSLPNLIELQRSSYENFLQFHKNPDERKRIGLQEVFCSIFPIKDSTNKAQLEFMRYGFDTPKYDEVECRQKGLTYAAPLRATFRLVVWDVDPDTQVKSIHDIKEQDVYMGDIPLMTHRGTFIVNGIERVIVSQMHRSPGVFFDHDRGKTHASGKYLYAARIIPYRGSWLDFEFDLRDILFVRIDRRRKVSLSSFLMALDSEQTERERARLGPGQELPADAVIGMSQAEILNCFYKNITYTRDTRKHEDICGAGWVQDFVADHWKGVTTESALIHAGSGVVLAKAHTKISSRMVRYWVQEGLKQIVVGDDQIVGQYAAYDYIDEETGMILVEAGREITADMLKLVHDHNITVLKVLYIDRVNARLHLINTLQAARIHNREEAMLEIYRALRPGEPPTVEGGEALLRALFFLEDRYDLSSVGRVKMNARLGLSTPDTQRTLTKQDFIAIIRCLLEMKDEHGEVDDIDNLGNRRVRSVGELVENQYRVGMVRMERSIRERMSAVDIKAVMPHDLVNAKPIASTIREFYGASQLSQFMDQVNPLSEITHKRRLSALGPGGLARGRAGFEVRDVHPTHYGRICPVETPEGPNIGLINSLASFAQVNKYGFIESPYRRVVDGQVRSDIVYLTAMEEGRHTITHANVALDNNQYIIDEFVTCRRGGEPGVCHKSEVDLIDVSPKQLVSVAASLIPFLENDDASRALMGSNMQRQAVPLLRADKPLIGTGMEHVVARDSGSVIVTTRSGRVIQVDGQCIVVQADEGDDDTLSTGVDVYKLTKFQGSNMRTCLNQKPIVRKGDVVSVGDIIADGPSTDLGDLALGQNVRVGFMSWQGYNFEDSILISEKLIQNDVFTSIHIEGFEVACRDTKLGNEEVTRDLPSVNEEFLRNLDESGIVAVGAEVNAGDILVGKVTPKGENPMTPEERLLRAIFGEKASDVRDTSLRVPSGVSGTVVEVRVFSRAGVDKDERSLAMENQEIAALSKNRDAEKAILERSFYNRLRDKLIGQTIGGGVKHVPNLKVGQSITAEMLRETPHHYWRMIHVKDAGVQASIEGMTKAFDLMAQRVQAFFNDRVEKLRRGDELPPGVLKMVKVFVAVKRKLQVGDKMAGRHGNKGVVSCILPVEDMPYMEDGTPLDIILNSLGVPARMNVGQILETHLGAAAYGLAKPIRELLEQHREKAVVISDLRNALQDAYENARDVHDIVQLSDEEILELARNVSCGIPMATPVFDGAAQHDIEVQLAKAGLQTSGQVKLYDGRTGVPFDRPVTVGYIYMLKLNHLVDDKIHARSIGPYSLVTQQPLGGKAQFGGQRFGEMEVWALEAYGAAYTLQEILTVKSDDVYGRMRAYESIVRGESHIEAGVPESFNVLVKELRSLGLSMSFEQSEEQQ